MAIKCQQCGGQIYKDEKFCPSCGMPVAAPQQVPQAPYAQPANFGYPQYPGYPNPMGGIYVQPPMMPGYGRERMAFRQSRSISSLMALSFSM